MAARVLLFLVCFPVLCQLADITDIGDTATPECSSDAQCPDDRVCSHHACVDPCPETCGLNTLCQVTDHLPACTCTPGFAWKILPSCFPEGTSGCTSNADCPTNRACQNYKCVDPCTGVCGNNTKCQVTNHTPACSCLQGFDGNPVTGCQIREVQLAWQPMDHEAVPPNAVLGGYHGDEKLYVCRTHHEGNIIPGKFISEHGLCYVAWGGQELMKRTYEILTGSDLKWVSSQDGAVPSNAVIGGYNKYGETLYIGRVRYEGTLTVGKIQPDLQRCSIGYNGEEHTFFKCEVLVQT